MRSKPMKCGYNTYRDCGLFKNFKRGEYPSKARSGVLPEYCPTAEDANGRSSEGL